MAGGCGCQVEIYGTGRRTAAWHCQALPVSCDMLGRLADAFGRAMHGCGDAIKPIVHGRLTASMHMLVKINFTRVCLVWIPGRLQKLQAMAHVHARTP